jgi:uncharacterized protein (DUF2267 family)
MQFDQFVGKVQHRAKLSGSDEALNAIQATLETLAVRTTGEEATNLAAQLPEEIGKFLKAGGRAESFSIDEFFNRVSIKEDVDKPVSVYHVRAVMSVLKEAVSAGEMEDLRAQLPDEYAPLFEAGIEGEMDVDA